jgi:hypothetical protein
MGLALMKLNRLRTAKTKLEKKEKKILQQSRPKIGKALPALHVIWSDLVRSDF